MFVRPHVLRKAHNTPPEFLNRVDGRLLVKNQCPNIAKLREEYFFFIIIFFFLLFFNFFPFYYKVTMITTDHIKWHSNAKQLHN